MNKRYEVSRYKKCWTRYIEETLKELNGEKYDNSIDWFEWEWN